jgi:DNA invertase Pin-like site-specific DNA recombinase
MNMSYCRFQNTLSDLRDCYHNWEGDAGTYEDSEIEELSDDEKDAREQLLELCKKIINEHDDEHVVATLDEFDYDE